MELYLIVTTIHYGNRGYFIDKPTCRAQPITLTSLCRWSHTSFQPTGQADTANKVPQETKLVSQSCGFPRGTR